MKISIVTPSLNASDWLRLCIASVHDQEGVDKEHIVQDACSDDGTPAWLSRDPRVRAYVEKDTGMYDAVNRGLRRAEGEVLAYLNADEQYLPGALSAVGEYFDANPDVDVVFSDTVVVDGEGRFECYRKTVIPSALHIKLAHLPVLTCAIFFRRRVLDRRNLYFDTRYRDIADAYWVLSLLRLRLRIGLLRRYTSAFTDTGENMNLLPNAREEIRQLSRSVPACRRLLKPLLVSRHRLRKWLAGGYRQEPFSYRIYTRADPDRRAAFHVTKPVGVWRSRLHIPSQRRSGTERE